MFTIDQIKAAHAKVKSGADFPQYIQDVIQLGVEGYETFVADGHTLFLGQDGFTAQSEPKYATLIIADSSNKSQFLQDLQEHQQGKTDFLTFCTACASYGVEKWVVSMANMTCTYYDKASSELLVEVIPH